MYLKRWALYLKWWKTAFIPCFWKHFWVFFLSSKWLWEQFFLGTAFGSWRMTKFSRLVGSQYVVCFMTCQVELKTCALPKLKLFSMVPYLYIQYLEGLCGSYPHPLVYCIVVILYLQCCATSFVSFSHLFLQKFDFLFHSNLSNCFAPCSVIQPWFYIAKLNELLKSCWNFVEVWRHLVSVLGRGYIAEELVVPFLKTWN